MMRYSPVEDPDFPHVTYRRGASGRSTPILSGTGIRIQAIITTIEKWGLTPEAAAEQFGISEAQVREALAFHDAHRDEIEDDIRSELALDGKIGSAMSAG